MNTKKSKPQAPGFRNASVSSPSPLLKFQKTPDHSPVRTRPLMISVLALIFACFGCANCLPVRNLLQPVRFLLGDAKVETNLSYHANSQNPRHSLDLIYPADLERPRGLVLFVHGGFWTNQDRRYYRPVTGLYWNVGYGLARAGYAAAILSYRIYPGARIAGQLSDIEAAVDWARPKLNELNIDPKRLFLMGHSAGGHLACLTALESPDAQLAGVIALSPVLDIAHMRASKSAEFNRTVTETVFGPDAGDEALRQWSPGLRWNAEAPPLLVLTGEKDYPFVKEQAARFAERFGDRRADLIIKELPGLDHADLVLQFDADPSPVLAPVLAFLADPTGARSASAGDR